MSIFDLLFSWYLSPSISITAMLYVLISDLILFNRMPPGPRPVPFIGNKFDIPKSHPWIQFQKWSETYGPVFTLWLGRRPTIIISDPEVAVDLLEKRSNKYSSRPRFVTMGEIYWDMASILVQPYGKHWSIRRKLLHTAMTPRALKTYLPVQTAEASRLCYQLLAAPLDWEALLDRFTSSIVFSVSYGHRIDSNDSPIIRQRLKFMHYAASLNVPGAYLVESFPILKHVPNFLAPWKAEVQRHGREEAAVNMDLVRVVQQDILNAKTPASVPPSLCKQLLEARAADPQSFSLLSDRDFSFIPASLFGAGSDTTASTLCSAFLALVTNTETLHAAHAELDTVVGKSRTPIFDDEKSLPYIRALCKEVLRWRPVAVLGGTPHASTEADTYRGFYIPAGTNVLGNTWAINLNELYYPNPHHFNPLRFLDAEPATLSYLQEKYLVSTPIEKGKAHPSKLGHSSFGKSVFCVYVSYYSVDLRHHPEF
jgi:cytochrome P450